MLCLKRAALADCALVFAWANDPDTRRHSLCSEPIAWTSHCAWFASRLRDPDCHFFIALDTNALPIGQIRFDIRGGRGAVSISLDAARRGRGYSVPLIMQGAAQVCRDTPVRDFDAWIKPENIASQRAFERAGFHNRSVECINGLAAYRFTFAADLNFFCASNSS